MPFDDDDDDDILSFLLDFEMPLKDGAGGHPEVCFKSSKKKLTEKILPYMVIPKANRSL